MPNLPAFCNTCGLAFLTDLNFENSFNISFSNVGVQCPRCGNMGHIPDGTYNFVGNVIEVLTKLNHSVSDLNRIIQALETAKVKQEGTEELLSIVKKELPELSTIADTIPKTRAELYAFIATIIAVLALMIPFLIKKEEPKIEIHNVINNIVKESSNTVNNQQKKPSVKNRKIGRNEICSCGSGRKYKKCHGHL